MVHTVYVTQRMLLTHEFEDDGIIGGYMVYANMWDVPKEDRHSVEKITLEE